MKFIKRRYRGYEYEWREMFLNVENIATIRINADEGWSGDVEVTMKDSSGQLYKFEHEENEEQIEELAHLVYDAENSEKYAEMERETLREEIKSLQRENERLKAKNKELETQHVIDGWVKDYLKKIGDYCLRTDCAECVFKDGVCSKEDIDLEILSIWAKRQRENDIMKEDGEVDE